MVLGKLPVPGRPTNLDCRRARAYCTVVHVAVGGGCFDIIFRLSSFSSVSLSLGDGPT